MLHLQSHIPYSALHRSKLFLLYCGSESDVDNERPLGIHTNKAPEIDVYNERPLLLYTAGNNNNAIENEMHDERPFGKHKAAGIDVDYERPLQPFFKKCNSW